MLVVTSQENIEASRYSIHVVWLKELRKSRDNFFGPADFRL